MPKLTEEQKKQQQEQQGEVAAAVVAEQPPEVAAEATTQQPQGNWYDAIEKAYAERMKADERADKRDRVRASIAGIGDIASALSNLYFTTQYAPNVPQGDTMSAAQRERADKMKASRDRNRAEWMNYMLNIAGRKQAAEQAEAARKDRKAYYDGVLANAQQKAEEKAKADAKKADKDATNAYIAENAPLWEAWYRDENEQEIAALENEWEDAKKEGTMSEDAYNARMSALHKQRNKVTNANSRAVQLAERRAASGGSGSKGNNYTYISFGGGRGVNINKNDEKEVAAAYRWVPREYGGERRSLNDAQMASIVRAFLKSDYSGAARENIEAHLQQVSKRSTSGEQTTAKKTGYSRNNTNGMKKGYTRQQ